MVNVIANRYAKAFLETLTKIEDASSVLASFYKFEEVCTANAELGSVLNSRSFLFDQKKKVLADVLSKLGIQGRAEQYLVTLLSKNRLKALPQIAKKFELLYLAKVGIIPLEVSSRKTLKDNEKEELEKKFSSLFGKKVKAYYAVEPKLIGGLKVSAFGKTYDGSLVGALKGFEDKRVGGV